MLEGNFVASRESKTLCLRFARVLCGRAPQLAAVVRKVPDSE